jgi:peptidoglycan/LPS O-acetylase OafA/YrhL
MPALDGLRALAVIAVLLYHANLEWIPGGFLGVEMFFVISGYLITSMLLAEWARNGRLDFTAFWLRRARRLLPALGLLLLVVVAYAVVFLPAEVAGLRGDAVSAAAYVNNWYQVFSHKSYFEAVGRPSLLRHLWSLAVEEQFYLVWPLLLGLLLAGLRRRYALAAVLAGALASSLAMAFLFQPNTDPSRVYYGTDTRAAGLLLGVALAFIFPPGEEVPESGAWVPDALGLAGFGTLVACFLLINEFQPFLYRGGFTLVDIATLELLAVAVHPGARLVPRLLCWGPLRWVGLRSYGIYLWHFPVFMLTRPQLDVPIDGVLLLAARLGLTVLIAALSYRFIETPIRSGGLGRSCRAWREAQGPARRWCALRWGAASLALLAAFSVLGVFLAMARQPAPPEYLVKAAVAKAERATKETTKEATKGSAPEYLLKTASAKAAPKVTALAATTPPPAPPLSALGPRISALATPLPPTPPPTLPLPPATPPRLPPNDIPKVEAFTAIGDSVMEGVADELKRVLGTNAVVDADQGRLPWNTPAIVRNLHAAGKINPAVILHIGNNGFMSPEVFGQIMAEFKGARRIVVVNLKVPRRWENPNNTMLEAAVKSYPNAVLVDWHHLGGDRPAIFWKDGIHLRPEGARFYASLIARALRAS